MNAIKRQDFARAVVEARTLEKKLIHQYTMEEMVDSRDIPFIQNVLKESGYPDELTKDLNKYNFDIFLRRALEQFAQELLSITPDPSMLDILFLEYDTYNMMAIFMREDKQVNFFGDLIHIPAHRAVRYQMLFQNHSVQKPDIFDEIFLEARALYQEKSPKDVQEMLDKRCSAQLLPMAQQSGVALFIEYARASLDFYNILSIYRLKRIGERKTVPVPAQVVLDVASRIFIGGGSLPFEDIKLLYTMPANQQLLMLDGTRYRQYLLEGVHSYHVSKDLSLLEKRMDDYLTDLFKRFQYTALGPEALLGYFHGRKIEVLNIRLLLTSIFLGVPKQSVMERLRESYA